MYKNNEKKQVLFFHGGGEGGYEADSKLADSLRMELGNAFEVHNPQIYFNDSLPDYGWLEQIDKWISSIKGEIILVGHSFGASMLLKYLSENRIHKEIKGLYLIAPPYWSGEEEWKKGLKLHKNYADQIPKDIPIFLYQCKDDEEVPFQHFNTYMQQIPWIVSREVESGGHQFNNDLSVVANDLRSL